MTNTTSVAKDTGRPPPRWILKVFTRLHVLIYRLSGGRLMNTLAGDPICIVTMTGAKSGRERVIPLMYVPDGDSLLLEYRIRPQMTPISRANGFTFSPAILITLLPYFRVQSLGTRGNPLNPDAGALDKRALCATANVGGQGAYGDTPDTSPCSTT